MPGEAKESKILNFAKTNLGYTTDENIDDEWIGAITMSSPVVDVLYGRVKDFDGIYESLSITKTEYLDNLSDLDLVEFF